MTTLILLMCMKNALNKIMNKKNYLKIQTNKKSMNQWYKTSIQVLTTTSHHQKWTQVSWLSTIMTQRTSLIIRNIFASITSDSYVDTREIKSKQIPPNLHCTTVYRRSNSRMFTNSTIFSYIRPVKCNVQILNVSKSQQKVLVLS